MTYSSDRTTIDGATRAQVTVSNTPSTQVDKDNFAVPAQRSEVPSDFKGIITAPWVRIRDLVAPFLTSILSRLDAVEVAALLALTKEADPVALAKIADLQKVIDAIPVAENLDPLKADIQKISAQYAALSTAKANQEDLDAAEDAILALQTAIAALPKTGTASPEELTALTARMDAAERALAVVEGIKGTLLIDDRSVFVVGGELYGGARRLTESDLERVAQDPSNPVGRPLAALLGVGVTELIATPKQLLTWFFATPLRVWRIEIATENANAGNRYLFVNNSDRIALSSEVGSQETVYRPSASTGNERINELRFVDESPSSTVITNFYVSVTDSSEPVPSPRITDGTALVIGDQFRYKDLIYTYAGIDESSGAWKATASESSDIVRWSGLNPKLAVHTSAIAAIEQKLASLGSTKTIYTTAKPLVVKTEGSVVVVVEAEGNGGITLATPLADGSEITLFDPYRRIRAGENTVTLAENDRWVLADGTYGTTPLIFTDNPLLGGSITFKYATSDRAWSSLLIYGTPVQDEATPQVAQAELDAIADRLDAAIADYTARLQTTNGVVAAIQALNTVQDDRLEAVSLQSATTKRKTDNFVVESFYEPTDNDKENIPFTVWVFVAYSVDGTKMLKTPYIRTPNSSALLKLPTEELPYEPPIHKSATNTGGNTWKTQLPLNVELKYSDNPLAAHTGTATFPAGIIASIAWYTKDSDDEVPESGTATMSETSASWDVPIPAPHSKDFYLTIRYSSGSTILYQWPLRG